ncbi:MAG: CPBP family intramembrane metalloprotease [Candidatus Cloacimonetes bacterium]|nr:CPBP family intramembrane metalloprotease [Candidatus Cloacimonadota bacterium]
MFTKKWFWILFTLISISSIFFVVHNFPKVMSFISIDITMNREEAFTKSKEISAQYDWGTADFRQVAIFSGSSGQTYIELEGGGKPAFNELLKSDFYSYYYWVVRNYKPGELLESSVYFKPTGEPYGFEVDYPEDMELPSLTAEEALELAKSKAESEWGIDFTNYKLNDNKMSTTPKGRKDYTIIYERVDKLINEAKFRITLKVNGDKFSGLEQRLKIPEAFERRYSEMRSSNNTIAGVGVVLMIVFYGICGIILGAFFLIKSKWLLWKKALFWGVFVSLLEFIASFNYLSLSWIWYQTSSTVNEHILNYIASSVGELFSNIILLSVSFMVAESLTRKAFGKHTQLWKSWSPKVANSSKILGNTIGAYLWVPLSLSYILVFYMITTKYFGWWNSSSLNVDPNTLATSLPWLSAVSMALHAGFWEECLFRAVPIAGAVLIGRRLGKETLFFWIGFALQIFIFGMGHANYPAQPSYARVIELIIPSIFFAVAYIRFGLLTGILIHFLFDAVLMGLPIWMVEKNEMMGNKILFIITLLIPILIIFFRRIQEKKFETDLSDSNNSAWEPVITEKVVEAKSETIKTTAKMSKKPILLLGFIGLLLTVFFFHSQYNARKLEVTKAEAVVKAEAILKSVGVDDLTGYETIVDVTNASGRYVNQFWHILGKDKFNELADEFLECNGIKVRFAKFHGDLQEKAEEFTIEFTKAGDVYRYYHKFHEEAEGNTLEEAEAVAIARPYLEEMYHINFDDLTLVSAKPELRDNRKDWYFTYKDTINYQLGENFVSYSIGIAGDKLNNLGKYIKLPEKTMEKYWSDSRTRDSIFSILNIITMLMYVSSLIIVIIAWTKKEFNLKVFFIVLLACLAVFLTSLALTFETGKMQYSTSQPYGHQLTMQILLQILLNVGISFYISMMLGYFAKNNAKGESLTSRISIGFIASGLFFLIIRVLPQLTAIIPDSKALVAVVPILGAVFGSLKALGASLALLVPSFIVLDKITSGFKKKSLLLILILLLMSASLTMKVAFINLESVEVITWLLVSVIQTILLYILIKRFIVTEQISVFWIGGLLVAFKTLSRALGDSFNGAGLYYLISFVVVLIAVMALDRLLVKKE